MPVGKHLIMRISGIKDKKVLEFLEEGKPLLDHIVNACDLHVVGQVGHQFTPTGYTYIYLLSESHMSVHTYPEYGQIYMDIFCCNPEFSQKMAIQTVKEVFQTEIVDWDLIHR